MRLPVPIRLCLTVSERNEGQQRAKYLRSPLTRRWLARRFARFLPYRTWSDQSANSVWSANRPLGI